MFFLFFKTLREVHILPSSLQKLFINYINKISPRTSDSQRSCDTLEVFNSQNLIHMDKWYALEYKRKRKKKRKCPGDSTRREPSPRHYHKTEIEPGGQQGGNHTFIDLFKERSGNGNQERSFAGEICPLSHPLRLSDICG